MQAGCREETDELERIKPMLWDPSKMSYVLGPV